LKMAVQDRFIERVPLASERYDQIFAQFHERNPVPWPGADPEMLYWIESIDIDSLSPWVTVTVAQAGRAAP
jgi:hypothetical protein